MSFPSFGQSSYPTAPDNGYAGLIADMKEYDMESRINIASPDALPFGIAVKQATTPTNPDDSFDLPAALTDKVIGLLAYSNSQNNIGLVTLSATIPGASILKGDRANVMTRGSMWVIPENAVVPGTNAYARFATSVNDSTKTQKGALSSDADGVAQVTTVTPTAAQNSTIFALRVAFVDAAGSPSGLRNKVWTFEYISDGSMTATEAVTGFKTVMAADLEFSALVTATGTTTLILTSTDTKGSQAFTVFPEGDGAMTVAATTPPAPTALRMPGSRWESTAAAGKPALLSFNRAHAY